MFPFLFLVFFFIIPVALNCCHFRTNGHSMELRFLINPQHFQLSSWKLWRIHCSIWLGDQRGCVHPPVGPAEAASAWRWEKAHLGETEEGRPDSRSRCVLPKAGISTLISCWVHRNISPSFCVSPLSPPCTPLYSVVPMQLLSLDRCSSSDLSVDTGVRSGSAMELSLHPVASSPCWVYWLQCPLELWH